MPHLIVAATAMELAPTCGARRSRAATGRGRLPRYTHAWHDIDMLITGVGMVRPRVGCSRALADTRYDLALERRCVRDFDPGLAPGPPSRGVGPHRELGAETMTGLTIQI